MAIKRIFVYRNNKVVEVTALRNRHKLYPAAREVMETRDGVMQVGEGEAKHVADEKLGKLIESGEFDRMYDPNMQ